MELSKKLAWHFCLCKLRLIRLRIQLRLAKAKTTAKITRFRNRLTQQTTVVLPCWLVLNGRSPRRAFKTRRIIVGLHSARIFLLIPANPTGDPNV